MFARIFAALLIAVGMGISGCGGGGGAGAKAVAVSVSQQSVGMAATTSDRAPNTSVTVSPDVIPSGGLYVQGSFTTHGLASISLNAGLRTADLILTFRIPSTLGVGVFTDTVTVQVCTDQQCNQQVSNSPLQFTVTYTVTAGDAVAASPTLFSLSPGVMMAGWPDTILTLNGAGFERTAQVYWNGTVRPTTYVSASQITAQIYATDLVSTGTNSVKVIRTDNPSVPSNALPITVGHSALSLTALSPTSVPVGNSAFVQTVLGTGFDATSTVLWNGSVRPTTFVSTNELLAQINATDVASAGTANVTVTRADVAPSSAKTVSIVTPGIDATSFQINPQHNAVVNFANIVAPSAFPLSSKWTATMNGPASYALIADGRVFATAPLAGGGSELTAFSAATGARLWGPVSIPFKVNAAYDNGRLFVLSAGVGSGSGPLSAYDAASGTQIWSIPFNDPGLFSAPPTATQGMVYVGGANRMYGVNQSDGSIAWTQDVANGSMSPPTVTVDGVYLSYICDTYGLRPLTGEQIWRVNYGCSGGGGGANGVAANGTFYAPRFYSFISGMTYDLETGAFIANYASSSTPLITSQTGYFMQSGTLKGISMSNGSTQWSFSGDGGLEGNPVLVNNYLFVSSTSGNFYALNASTGSQLWQVNLGGRVGSGLSWPFSGLSAGGGLLVVPVGNTLTAYTLSNNP